MESHDKNYIEANLFKNWEIVSLGTFTKHKEIHISHFHYRVPLFTKGILDYNNQVVVINNIPYLLHTKTLSSLNAYSLRLESL